MQIICCKISLDIFSINHFTILSLRSFKSIESILHCWRLKDQVNSWRDNWMTILRWEQCKAHVHFIYTKDSNLLTRWKMKNWKWFSYSITKLVQSHHNSYFSFCCSCGWSFSVKIKLWHNPSNFYQPWTKVKCHFYEWKSESSSTVCCLKR